jgi:SAM-dependent methyltransferase
MSDFGMPDIRVPDDMKPEEMPDLLRYWYLGTRGRRHMVLRRFYEVDVELDRDSNANGVSGRDSRGRGDGERVLDVGSAWGYNIMALSAMGKRPIGLDLVVDQFEAGARIAVSNGIDFRAVGADAAALPFPNGTFDSITMVETFEHVFESDRLRALRECCRVLRPGGRLVMSTPNYASVVERFKRLAVRLPWLQRRLPTMCYPADETQRGEYHPYRYHQPAAPGDIARLLVAAGFDVMRTKYFLFVLKNTPDALFPLIRAGEALLERTPGLRRLAATVCLTARKPS